MLLIAAMNSQTKGRAWLKANDTALVPPEIAERFDAFCRRRLAGEPLAYITGHGGFYGLDLTVDARVLDPRPDTETIVSWALEMMTTCQGPDVLDLGTGSGAIALAVQHERPDAKVIAIDASACALEVAQTNADNLKLPVRFIKGSWFDPIRSFGASLSPISPAPVKSEITDACFDLIVSNPPYIAENDPHLPALVHEPIEALTSGPDGLSDIRLIIAQAPDHLKPGGWLLLEHGYDQAEAVTDLLLAQGFENVQSRNDLAGIARCTGGQKPIPGDRG